MALTGGSPCLQHRLTDHIQHIRVHSDVQIAWSGSPCSGCWWIGVLSRGWLDRRTVYGPFRKHLTYGKDETFFQFVGRTRVALVKRLLYIGEISPGSSGLSDPRKISPLRTSTNHLPTTLLGGALKARRASNHSGFETSGAGLSGHGAPEAEPGGAEVYRQSLSTNREEDT